MRPGLKYLIALFFALSVIDCNAIGTGDNQGVSMGLSTRIIYHSDEKRVSFPVYNKTKDRVLFHGLILDKNKEKFSPYFIVGPEIVHISGHQTKSSQIVRIGGEFPEDRESLFFLQGHFVPSMKDANVNGSNVTFSYALQMKMFFRPEKLRASFDAIDESAEDIDFKVNGKELTVYNKSPYFFTINYLRSEDQFIHVPKSLSMIEPFGNIVLDIGNLNPEKITWSLLNDGGYATKPLTRKL